MTTNHLPTTTYTQYQIDDSRAVTIRFESIRRPDEEYWSSFDEAKRLHNLGKYQEAKEIFLSLVGYDGHQELLFEHLVRTYRTIIRGKRRRSFVQTYKEFAEYFRVCERHITKYDVRNLNKLIADIGKKYTIVKDRPIEIPEVKRKPRIPEVYIENGDNVKLVGEIPRLLDKLVLDELKRRRNEGFRSRHRPLHQSILHPLPFGRSWGIGLSSRGTVLARSYFNRDLGKFDKAFVILRDRNGAIVNERMLDHSMNHFGAARCSDKIVGISDGYFLHLYSLEHGRISACDIRNTITDMPDGWSLDGGEIEGYSITNICLSPDGEFVLITICGGAWLLGAGLEPVASWIPYRREETDWEQLRIGHGDPRRHWALQILDLAENYTEEEIKRAFRSKIMQAHPDLHPGDESANEHTKDILDAYNVLAQSPPEIEDSPGISVIFRSLSRSFDWVYAAWLEPQAESLYLGYYSGLVKHVTRNGVVEEIFDCNDTVYSIRRIERLLQVVTRSGIYIIEGSRCVAAIPRGEGVKWAEFGFIITFDKEVAVFSNAGREIAKIRFKSKVYAAHGVGQKLEVITHYKRYIFDIS